MLGEGTTLIFGTSVRMRPLIGKLTAGGLRTFPRRSLVPRSVLSVAESPFFLRFLIPLGMALGAGVTWPQFLSANLLPVTLGNIVGGAIAVCGLYSGAFGSLFGKKKKA